MIYKHTAPFKSGYNPIIVAENHKDMHGLEYGIVVLNKNEHFEFNYTGQEVVYDLLFGQVVFKWDDKTFEGNRKSCFHEGAQVLHVHKDVAVTLEGVTDYSEVAIMRIPNEKTFENKFLMPEDCLDANEHRGSGVMDDAAERIVRTFFDRSNCPETNFFLGEDVHFPGKWSSYPPHTHEEPEMYYYKMLPENGYGFSEYCGDAKLIKNNDCLGFPSKTQHSQVVAPGYSMFYVWCIPLKEDRNIQTVVVDEFKWAADPNAKFFPNEI